MELHAQIVTALRRIIRAVDRHSKELVRRHGLTGPQLVVLRSVAEAPAGARSVGDLAEQVSLAQPTVTGIVDRLEQRGLASRGRDRFDRRRVLVEVTAAGRALIAEAPPLLQERFLERLGRLEDWEQNLILASLQRVVHMMEAADLDAAPHLVSGPIGTEPDADVSAVSATRPRDGTA